MSVAPGLFPALRKYINQRTPTWVRGARPATQTATPKGQPAITVVRAGEALSDGASWLVMRAYTSDQIGAQGGPGLDDMVFGVSQPGSGIRAVLGHFARPGDPANDFCPLVLVCDPPLGKPVGNIGLGPWASKTVAPDGYVYDGDNTYAHLFVALDENDKADIAYARARKADGTFFSFGSVWNLFADWDNPPIGQTEGVGVSEFVSGVMHAWGGIVTAVVSGHDPTDADIAKDPYLDAGSGAVHADGTSVVRQDANHKATFYRANNEINRLANLSLFAGTDASGETINHGEGDLGYGTDGSFWVCTTAGTPGTWKKTYPTETPFAWVIGSTLLPIAWTAATSAVISWDIAIADTSGFWSAGNPTRLTAPADGLYEIVAQVRVTYDAADTAIALHPWGIGIGVEDAGVPQIPGTLGGQVSGLLVTDPGSSVNAASLTIVNMRQLVAGEYVELSIALPAMPGTGGTVDRDNTSITIKAL